MSRPRTVRDPLWHNVRLEAEAAAVVDTPEFQRLRRVKQLGFAHLVYPGAVHTRFLHALGVYHLTCRALGELEGRGALEPLGPEDRELLPLIPLAALLHDVGHYAFSHAMEEVEPDSLPGHHEELADRFLRSDAIRAALEEVHPEGPARAGELIRGRSEHPLQGLVSGSLDLDKIDYLRRDAFFCGVPYGAVDVDRLLDALTLAREGPDRPLEVAVTEKGITALESLLFSKYQMFRNVYWHHTVRAATSAFRRLVESAVRAGLLGREELPGRTDEELMSLLAYRSGEMEAGGRQPAGAAGGPGSTTAHGDVGGAEDGTTGDDAAPMERVRLLHAALVDRRLPKRSVEIFGDEIPDGMGRWMQTEPALVRRLEDRLAHEWGAGAVLVDYPAYPKMLELDLLLVRRDGDVQRLTSAGEEGLIALPRLSRRLHHSARVFRVYTVPGLGRKAPGPVVELLEAPADEVEARLDEGRPLYG
jgi:hypothetical protein